MLIAYRSFSRANWPRLDPDAYLGIVAATNFKQRTRKMLEHYHVYQATDFLGLPESICARLPTTDTCSLPQWQEEFYFFVPYEKLGLIMF